MPPALEAVQGQLEVTALSSTRGSSSSCLSDDVATEDYLQNWGGTAPAGSTWRIATWRIDRRVQPLHCRQKIPSHATFGPRAFRGSISEYSDASGVADPFLIHHRGLYYLFYELMLPHLRLGSPPNNYTGGGVINVAMSRSGVGDWANHYVVLHPGYHLSYPNVQIIPESGTGRFRFFMVPSSAAHGKVVLWESECFPYEWKEKRTLLQGRPFSDPSFVQWRGKWYLFTSNGLPTNISSDHTQGQGHRGAYPANSVLWLFIADALDGEWTEHPGSPFLDRTSKYTRCAGNPFVTEDGELYRRTQDDSLRYGEQVHVIKILELSPIAFSEELPLSTAGASTGSADGVRGAPRAVLRRTSAWNAIGTHHYSAVPLGLAIGSAPTRDAHETGHEYVIATDGVGVDVEPEALEPPLEIQALRCPSDDEATSAMHSFQEEASKNSQWNSDVADPVLKGVGDEGNPGSGTCRSVFSWGWRWPDYYEFLGNFTDALELGEKPGMTLFETSVGTGNSLEVVAIRYPQVHVAGQDIARTSALKVRTLFPAGKFCWGDSTNISWVPDGTFDRVVSIGCMGAFAWGEMRDSYMKEMLRILKPAGRVGILTAYSSMGPGQKTPEEWLNKFVESGHASALNVISPDPSHPALAGWQTYWAFLTK